MLSRRFLSNVPLSSWQDLFFSVESAYYFYLDRLRAQDSALPLLQLFDFARLCVSAATFFIDSSMLYFIYMYRTGQDFLSHLN